jgi:hypothetical protein
VTGAEVIRQDFRSVGGRNASIFAVLYFALHTGILSVEAVFKVIDEEGKSDKLPLDKIKEALSATR